MDGTDSTKDQVIADRDSASSANKLILDNKPLSDGRSSDKQRLSTKKNSKKKKSEPPPPPQSPADRPSFRGPFGITTASTITWYVAICILFVIAFLSLILSVLYFVTNTTTDKILKLYGICGSGALAIVTFVIIFLDCCNDGSKKDHEAETLYRVYQAKEEKEKAIAMRRARRIAEGKEEKPKPLIIPHQRTQKISAEPPPKPHHHPHHHHVHIPPPTTYHHPFVCPICHDLHASGNARHNLTDVAVDTSDKFAPVSKTKKTTHKSTRDVQTEHKLWDAEHGTQTDRTEGTQTSAMELSGLPGNISEIIHETTILKAPRSLISTLKKSMAQQDRDIAMNRAMNDTDIMTATII